MLLYINPKPVITEENFNTRDTFIYVESLFQSEIIFIEFCELFFLIIRRLIMDNIEPSENVRVKDKDKEKEYVMEKMYVEHLSDLAKTFEAPHLTDLKYKIFYPKLDHHYAYEKILENERARKEEEEKRILRLLRLEKERKLMENDDINVAPDNYSEGKRDDDDDSQY